MWRTPTRTSWRLPRILYFKLFLLSPISMSMSKKLILSSKKLHNPCSITRIRKYELVTILLNLGKLLSSNQVLMLLEVNKVLLFNKEKKMKVSIKMMIKLMMISLSEISQEVFLFLFRQYFHVWRFWSSSFCFRRRWRVVQYCWIYS